jgi:excisionase family DNA binding protein
MESTVRECPPQLLTLKQAAALLNYSTRNTRRLVESHGLPALRLAGPGSALRIPRGELERWLEERRSAHA